MIHSMKRLAFDIASYACGVWVQFQHKKYIFDSAFFNGKKVIAIGPADTAFSYLQGADIDRFDVIVRINSSMRLVSKHGDKIGHRTDFLAHSLYEGGDRGTGPIDASQLAKQKTRYVVCTVPNRSKWIPFLRLRKRFERMDWVATEAERPEVKISFPRRYRFLQDRLGGIAPTTGLATLDVLLSANCTELHITGFTFFGTAYVDGYKEGVIGQEETAAWGQNSKHDMREEMALFKFLLAESWRKGKTVKLDDYLTNCFKE